MLNDLSLWRVDHRSDEQGLITDSEAMFQGGDIVNDRIITLQTLTDLTVSYNLTTSEEDDFRS